MSSSSQPSVLFHVTGFGPFCGVDNNPTTRIVKNLTNYIQTDHPIPDKILSQISISSTTIFETSAVGAGMVLSELLQKHQISQQQQQQTSTVVFLHLGVNGGGTHFLLEKTAYNEASFRVPDERGWTPMKQSVHPSITDITHQLNTTLPIEELQRSTNNRLKTEVSTDPGRFLCNYIYYQSLHFSNINKTHSLFLHVPPFEVIPEQQQMSFVSNLIRDIACLLLNTNV
eukprot:TRINITY_DN18136_c0_g1_i1.p1 TRINITY_DN18136_c0_g1~~TRINITY_DN18136_c0_g1_i1.p1  ORF type:complete len:228 (+),score=49.84 TRINITY_DN18136_c0_g1_i1:6-689(+)